MSARLPQVRYKLPPLTKEIVTREVSSDTSVKRAIRANIVFQASERHPEMISLYSPQDAGLLLRHAISAVEVYQETLAVRELVNDIYSPEKTSQLKKSWQNLPSLSEEELKAAFQFWHELSLATRKNLLSIWWRSEMDDHRNIVGISDNFFTKKLRNIHEQKMMRAMAERVLESVSLLLDDGEFDEEFVHYIICLAWRESMIHHELRDKLPVNEQR